MFIFVLLSTAYVLHWTHGAASSTASPTTTSTCGPHETFSDCAPDCEPTCANPHPICPDFCILNGGKCKCTGGYVRSPSRVCVLPSECPTSSKAPGTAPMSTTPICGTNEHYGCGCDTPCGAIGPVFCPFVPAVCSSTYAHCICNSGYQRSVSGDCVAPSACPTSSATSTIPSVHVCNRLCRIGTHCVIEDGGPTCVPDGTTKTTTPSAHVCNLLCRIGSHCVIQNGKPTCIPNGTTSTTLHPCTLPCPLGYHCGYRRGKPRCIKSRCALHKRCPCSGGEHCLCIDPLPNCPWCCAGCFCIPPST